MSEALLERIDAALASESLAPARRKALSLMRKDPERTLSEPFTRLAERSGSSVPTLLRIVRALGYPGLPEFKLALAAELAHAQALGGSALHRRVTLADPPAQVVRKVALSAAATVSSVATQLDPAVLAAAADAIAQANVVHCWSVGQTSAFMASDFQSRLFRMGLVAYDYRDQHLQLASAATLAPGSVALAISHVGGMPSLMDAVEVARAQGACVIGLTQPGTPLAKAAHLVLTVQVPDDPVMHVGTEAYLAHITALEILHVLIAQRLGEPALRRFAQVREVLATHGLDVQHQARPTWMHGNKARGSR